MQIKGFEIKIARNRNNFKLNIKEKHVFDLCDFDSKPPIMLEMLGSAFCGLP